MAKAVRAISNLNAILAIQFGTELGTAVGTEFALQLRTKLAMASQRIGNADSNCIGT